ncbi:hypothetical protein [Nocardia sp. NPDC052566]|uniref:hypothetical protein n=1 Tax=Nocardia sp. NPDC052566 TaxID=3364330 RepID=UPI0037CC2044
MSVIRMRALMLAGVGALGTIGMVVAPQVANAESAGAYSCQSLWFFDNGQINAQGCSASGSVPKVGTLNQFDLKGTAGVSAGKTWTCEMGMATQVMAPQNDVIGFNCQPVL